MISKVHRKQNYSVFCNIIQALRIPEHVTLAEVFLSLMWSRHLEAWRNNKHTRCFKYCEISVVYHCFACLIITFVCNAVN